MATTLIFLQLLIVLAMIFIGAKVGGIGLGIYGMVGIFILVFGFGLEPGVVPIDVMLIIVSVITASAALQAAGGQEKVRPERPLSVATISASMGCTGSPVSAATAAILSESILGASGIGMKDIMAVTIPASIIAILVASLVQNRVGKPLEKDPEYQRRLGEGLFFEVSEATGVNRVVY